jgi:hypothetical protein
MNQSIAIAALFLIAAILGILWYGRWKGRNMIPIGIGDPEAQTRFMERYKPFLIEYPEISNLLKKVFLRKLDNPPEDEIKAIDGLADDDPRVLKFDEKVLASRVIFYLGRIAVDDFSEIITLAGNGRGFGAYKVLRGMYERLVTASFIAMNPTEAQPFMEEESIQNWKLWQSALKIMPEIKDRYSADEITGLEKRYKAAKAKKSESICKRCGQPKTDQAWTRVDLATMAQRADVNLAVLYGRCYLEPTFHSHATGLSISRRLRRNDDDTGWTFREITEKEARTALHLAHNLILRVLKLHNGYFELGLESEIQSRIDAFQRVWAGIPPIDDEPDPLQPVP